MKPGVVLFLAFLPVFASAQIGSEVKSSGSPAIEGIWHNNQFGFEMVLMLNQGGTGEFDGETISYKISANQLIITSQSGTTNYQYVLQENQLILSGGDLDNPVTFTKQGAEVNTSGQANNISQQGAENNNDLVGKWESSTENLEFRNDGTVIVQGTTMTYKVTGNNLTIISPNGTQTFSYSVQPNYLTINYNGQNQMYRKAGGTGTMPTQGYSQNQGNNQGQNIQGGQGVIAQELVGKWCYMNLSSTGSGSWSTDECIVINADGTYEYNFSSSGSASGYNQYGDQTFAGGTSGQSSDQGTWRLAGTTLYVQSQSKGPQTLTLQKVNNPKNGDPMIMINGRAYVTYYQKPSW